MLKRCNMTSTNFMPQKHCMKLHSLIIIQQFRSVCGGAESQAERFACQLEIFAQLGENHPYE